MKKQLVLKESGVEFDEAQHRYWLNGVELQGITSTLVRLAYPGTYDGVDEDTLRHAAERGTMLHKAVGLRYTMPEAAEDCKAITDEAQRLLESKGLKPECFEYIVTDGSHFASPIDILCTDKKGGVCIVDMKFTYQLHYPEVTMQTSIYKHLFEKQNPGMEVKSLYCLWIGTDDTLKVRASRLEELTPVDGGIIEDLMQAYLTSQSFSMATYYGDLPSTVANVEDYMQELDNEIKQKTDTYNSIKEGLLELMEKYNVKTWQSERMRLTRVLPTVRTSIDTKRLKADHPDIAREYSRISETRPSLKITFNEAI